MESLKRERGAIRRAITNMKTKENIDADIIVDKEERLRTLNKEIRDIMANDPSTSESTWEDEMDKVELYRELIVELKRKCSNGDHGNKTGVKGIKYSTRLPQIEWFPFDGEVQNWPRFWGQFKKVHEDVAIPDEDKFVYLNQAVTGRAKKFLENFPLLGENYGKAVSEMKRRFAREEVQIDYYVRQLIGVVIQRNCFKLSELYDKLMSNITNLQALGLTSDKYKCIMIPLIESSLPQAVLREWEKQKVSQAKNPFNFLDKEEDLLETLIEFLRMEVETEEKLNTLEENKDYKTGHESTLETGQDLLNKGKFKTRTNVKEYQSKSINCIFCEKASHNSQDCIAAQKMTLEERQNVVKNKRACFKCLKLKHSFKFCKTSVKCVVCSKQHYALMCLTAKDSAKSHDCRSIKNSEVLLQTVKVTLLAGDRNVSVRCLLDSGSSFSYIKESVVKRIGLKCIERKKIKHCLFGGKEKKEEHQIFNVQLFYCDNSISVNLLSQENICSPVKRLSDTKIMAELDKKRITIEDVGSYPGEIHVLLGADVIPRILTGRMDKIESLCLLETTLGWTIFGEIGKSKGKLNNAISCLNHESVKDFWALETMGIREPAEQKTKFEEQQELLKEFKNTLRIDKDNRYEITLPWTSQKSELMTNFNVAKWKLEQVTDKLNKSNKLKDYDDIFKEWESEGIIREVPIVESGHFLSHRPVYKETSQTTKTRPVFNASLKGQNNICLNDCMSKGLNMIELIPELLLQFRLSHIGISADIKKAFLQISVKPEDRHYMKFLWWENIEGKVLKCYEHNRVMFGMKSSPFLLGATLLSHLDKMEKEYPVIVNKLKQSFYVDNCIYSVTNSAELDTFIRDSNNIMAEGKFQLRCWTHSKVEHVMKQEDCCSEKELSVLGVLWNNHQDSLRCTFKDQDYEKVTKRQILSIIQSIYDPIGITAAVTILPKRIMQKAWADKLEWDTELPTNMKKEFLNWMEKLRYIKECTLDRCFMLPESNLESCSIHVFVDGSKLAYAGCVFIRCHKQDEVKISLLLAKSRVTPMKDISIPRIELLAATLGVRLYSIVVKNETLSKLPVFFWSDSQVVLAWIKNNHVWKPFVKNRVQEIRTKTSTNNWHHCPGSQNPADLLSRGCDGYQLKTSQWWKGPDWLREKEDRWPKSKVENLEMHESLIKEEESKSTCCINIQARNTILDRLIQETDNFSEAIRATAYMLKFLDKQQEESQNRAETLLVKLVQKECFSDNQIFKNLNVFKDTHEIMRVKSKLTLTDGEQDYVYPILLPHGHELVHRLIRETHHVNKHPGVLTTMVILRKKYWILKCRKTVKTVLRKCIRCQRFNSRAVQTPSAPLPLFRLGAYNAFENCAMDCAGPLYTSEGKVWLLLFTCAVFRAIHIEVINSLSTESFLMGLRRMVARRGRMARMLSDNGTNFVCANQQLNNLDWNKIKTETSLQRIEFHFNPPASPWWGGFYERLIGIVKDILRKNLGHTLLNLEELNTLVIETESIVNLRPLTYFSEEDNLTPLTPALFISNIYCADLDDLDENDRGSCQRRIQYAQKLRDALKTRFQQEYVGTLMAHSEKRNQKRLEVGDIVLVGSDNSKRINWPLGRIVEICQGSDGNNRVAKVKVSGGVLTRPFQRLYPMEINKEDPLHNIREEVSHNEPSLTQTDDTTDTEVRIDTPSQIEICEKVTKRGRAVKIPQRYL